MAVTVIAEALTTLVSAKSALGIATAVTTDDELIKELINAASVHIEEQCNRKLVRRDYNGDSGTHADTSVGDEAQYRFSGDGISSSHILPQYPVDEDSTFLLELLDQRGSGVSGKETWESTTYVLWNSYVVDWEMGIIRILTDSFSNAFFAYGIRNLRVTYTAGYKKQAAAPWVPEDLQRACNEVVKDMFKDGSNLSSERIGTWARSRDLSKENPLINPVIEKYKAISNLIV